jgi:hypothetical protein
MWNHEWKHAALMLVFAASLWGCGHTRETGLFEGDRVRLVRMDDFGMLLINAGVDVKEIPADEALAVEQANDLLLWLRFKLSDGNMSAYGPRIMASFLLEEAVKAGKDIPQQEECGSSRGSQCCPFSFSPHPACGVAVRSPSRAISKGTSSDP